LAVVIAGSKGLVSIAIAITGGGQMLAVGKETKATAFLDMVFKEFDFTVILWKWFVYTAGGKE
jgi:hypothetical protein